MENIENQNDGFAMPSEEVEKLAQLKEQLENKEEVKMENTEVKQQNLAAETAEKAKEAVEKVKEVAESAAASAKEAAEKAKEAATSINWKQIGDDVVGGLKWGAKVAVVVVAAELAKAGIRKVLHIG